MNFLNETLKDILTSGHSTEDIIFIGSLESGHSCTWEEFKRLADVEYDNGLGGTQVANDLKIIFKDKQYMFRSEYDGSEWWDYCKPFHLPKETKKIDRVMLSSFQSMEEMHDPIVLEMMLD